MCSRSFLFWRLETWNMCFGTRSDSSFSKDPLCYAGWILDSVSCYAVIIAKSRYNWPGELDTSQTQALMTASWATLSKTPLVSSFDESNWQPLSTSIGSRRQGHCWFWVRSLFKLSTRLRIFERSYTKSYEGVAKVAYACNCVFVEKLKMYKLIRSACHKSSSKVVRWLKICHSSTPKSRLASISG